MAITKYLRAKNHFMAYGTEGVFVDGKIFKGREVTLAWDSKGRVVTKDGHRMSCYIEENIAKERGVEVDESDFRKVLREEKDIAR